MWSGNVVVAAINSGNLGFLFSSQGRLPSARNDRGVGGGLFRSHDATVGEYLIMLDKCFKYCKSVSTETEFFDASGCETVIRRKSEAFIRHDSTEQEKTCSKSWSHKQFTTRV